MRNFLKQNFWSHGTPLGYVGSLSQKGPPEIFSKWVLFNLSNPLRHPAPLVDPLLTKNLDTAGPWCVGFADQIIRFKRFYHLAPFFRSGFLPAQGSHLRSPWLELQPVPAEKQEQA